MSVKIITKIYPDGKTVTVKVEGFKGPGCKRLTEEFERLLGRTVSDDATEEMYAEDQNKNLDQA